ncbi:hypothetical protein ACQY0O_007822 [Thecaphora frezii]
MSSDCTCSTSKPPADDDDRWRRKTSTYDVCSVTEKNHAPSGEGTKCLGPSPSRGLATSLISSSVPSSSAPADDPWASSDEARVAGSTTRHALRLLRSAYVVAYTVFSPDSVRPSARNWCGPSPAIRCSMRTA